MCKPWKSFSIHFAEKSTRLLWKASFANTVLDSIYRGNITKVANLSVSVIKPYG